MTLLVILMKYNRYTTYFIGLVHIFMLYTSSLYWLIHDNYCIVDTLPDAYFACYRLAHDDGKCMNCMSLLLHRIDIDCFRFEFRFFSFLPSSLQIGVSIRFHISLAFMGFTICILYKLQRFPRLELGPTSHKCLSWSRHVLL